MEDVVTACTALGTDPIPVQQFHTPRGLWFWTPGEAPHDGSDAR